MSLSAALQIGRSALNASQLGIQIAGNNMANAGTVGYSRQKIGLEALRGDQSAPAGGAGNGVRVSSVNRQIDQALAGRLNSSGSDAAAAQTQQQIFSQIESTLGELGSNDLSNELTSFFKVWSERANQTKSSASVVQQGDRMASFIRNLRGDMTAHRKQVDDQVGSTVGQANEIISSIAHLNSAISVEEGNGGAANTLRDQRDQAVSQLSELMDVSVVDHGLGGIDVLVGSAPVVLGSRAKTLELHKQTTSSGDTSVSVRTTGDQSQELSLTSGQIGALLQNRDGAIDATINRLDTLASGIIFEVNKLHSTATNADGMTSCTGTLSFSAADRALSLKDPLNQAASNLPFGPVSGGFMVNVRDKASGAMQTVRINIDLDGVNNLGAPGATDDTSPEQIRASLDSVPGISASFTPDGKLKITADSGSDFSFSDDNTGVLATLGMNAYFTGTKASDIAVRTDLVSDPGKLSSGAMVNGQFVENAAALKMANLQDKGIASLGGSSISQHWADTAQAVGGGAAAAKTNAAARAMVHDSLQSQRDSISGVNIDEESISLLDYQRQYQAAARVISTVDQMTQSLLSML
jgi:flagellar hook-associated protein 1 FlgK